MTDQPPSPAAGEPFDQYVERLAIWAADLPTAARFELVGLAVVNYSRVIARTAAPHDDGCDWWDRCYECGGCDCGEDERTCAPSPCYPNWARAEDVDG